MAPTATKDQVDRLGELIGETAKMPKAEVLAALVELGVDDEEIHGWPLAQLRGTLAAVRLDRERRDAGTADSRDIAGAPEQDDAHPNPPTEAEEVEGEAVEVDETGAVVPAEVADEVGQALALREETPAPVSALPSVAEFNASMAIAEKIASTSMVPESFRGKPDDVLAAILFGREIGLGPMQSLRDIHMIEGRPALAAHRQMALLRRGGVRVLDSESTATRAWIRAQRADTGEIAEVEWTIEEARTAGLTGKKNWERYPADMLYSRCVGRLSRRLGPDLLGGLPPYTAEEVADFSGYGVEYGELGPEIHRPTGSTPAPGNRTVPARETKGPERPDPRGWPAIFALAAEWGESLGWPEWTRDAMVEVYKVDDRTKLTPEQLGALGTKSKEALLALWDVHPPTVFPPPSRAEVATAWASVLDGTILPGPMWQMSPEEAELGIPTVYEAKGIEAPSAPESPPEAPATETSDAAPEGASGPEDDPETVEHPEPDGDADGVEF